MKKKDLPPPTVSDVPSEVITPKEYFDNPEKLSLVEILNKGEPEETGNEKIDSEQPETLGFEGEDKPKRRAKKKEHEEAPEKRDAPRGAGSPQPVQWPARAKVNAYNFIHLSTAIMADLGFTEGEITPITIDKAEDGSLIIKKA